MGAEPNLEACDLMLNWWKTFQNWGTIEASWEAISATLFTALDMFVSIF